MIKIFLHTLTIIFIYLGIYDNAVLAFGKDDIIPRGDSIVPAGALPSGTGFLDGIAEYIKNSIFGILVLVIIGMFLYIGFRLIIARGQPEEFTKTMKSLAYVIIGIFVVSVAWLAVRLVSGINI